MRDIPPIDVWRAVIVGATLGLKFTILGWVFVLQIFVSIFAGISFIMPAYIMQYIGQFQGRFRHVNNS